MAVIGGAAARAAVTAAVTGNEGAVPGTEEDAAAGDGTQDPDRGLEDRAAGPGAFYNIILKCACIIFVVFYDPFVNCNLCMPVSRYLLAPSLCTPGHPSPSPP